MKVSRVAKSILFNFRPSHSAVLALSLVALAIPQAFGKDLSQRIGLGATNIGPRYETPALSVDWQLSEATAFEVDLGMDTQASSNTFLLGLRYSRNLYIENQQFFFMYLGGGLLTVPNGTSNAAGYVAEAGVGAKFFFDNLPNLGFSVGAGFRLESPVSVRIRTAAFTGFHYYF